MFDGVDRPYCINPILDSNLYEHHPSDQDMEVTMNIGMLWFDNDKRSDCEAKIERAAAYYQKKYGKIPNLCFVHPGTMPAGNDSQLTQSRGIEIRTSKTMLPNHFWIGVDD